MFRPFLASWLDSERFWWIFTVFLVLQRPFPFLRLQFWLFSSLITGVTLGFRLLLLLSFILSWLCWRTRINFLLLILLLSLFSLALCQSHSWRRQQNYRNSINREQGDWHQKEQEQPSSSSSSWLTSRSRTKRSKKTKQWDRLGGDARRCALPATQGAFPTQQPHSNDKKNRKQKQNQPRWWSHWIPRIPV